MKEKLEGAVMSKALDLLQEIWDTTYLDDASFLEYPIFDENDERFEQIKQALKRNEPMKPIQNNDPRFYDCPNCQENISSVENYCPDCGQKLDWSEWQ